MNSTFFATAQRCSLMFNLVVLLLGGGLTTQITAGEKRLKTAEQPDLLHTFMEQHSQVFYNLSADIAQLQQLQAQATDDTEQTIDTLVGQKARKLLNRYAFNHEHGLMSRWEKESMANCMHLVQAMDKLDMTKTAFPHSGQALNRSSALYKTLELVCSKIKRNKKPLTFLRDIMQGILPQALEQKLVQVFVEQETAFKKWLLSQQNVSVAQLEYETEHDILKIATVPNSTNVRMLVKKPGKRYKLITVTAQDETLESHTIHLTQLAGFNNDNSYRYDEHVMAQDNSVVAFIRTSDDASELVVYKKADQSSWAAPLPGSYTHLSLALAEQNDSVMVGIDPTDDQPRTMLTFAVSSGKLVSTKRLPVTRANVVFFSPNGRYCATITPLANARDPLFGYSSAICYLYDTQTNRLSQLFANSASEPADSDTLQCWFNDYDDQLLLSTNKAVYFVDLATVADGRSCLDHYPSMQCKQLTDDAEWVGNVYDTVCMLSLDEIQIADKHKEISACFDHNMIELTGFDYSSDVIIMSGIKDEEHYFALWSVPLLNDAIDQISSLSTVQIALVYRIYQASCANRPYQLLDEGEQAIYESLPAWAKHHRVIQAP